jgi:hypothetical protein
MADEIYTYAITAFGSGEFDSALLRSECQAALGAEPFQIVYDGTDVDLYFTAAVNQTTLDGIVAAHTGTFEVSTWERVVIDPVIEPVIPGSSKVVANDRPAIEVVAGITGFAAIQGVWQRSQSASAEIRVTVKFILRWSGTGSNVRIASRVKFQGTGEDSAATWDSVGFVAVPVTFTTIGEVFEAVIIMDASAAKLHDAMALQIGRDGSNFLGAGTNDDVDQAIQLIALEVEGR